MTPPHDEQLEVEIIKMMMDDKDSLPILFSKLKPKHFYSDTHKANFMSACKDYQSVCEIDTTKFKLVSRYLDSDHFNSSNFANEFADKLINLSDLREIYFHNQEPLGDNAKEYIEKTVRKFSTLQDDDNGIDYSGKIIASKAYDKWCEDGDKMLGLPTGIESFDEMIDGYCPSHYWVIGAYTNYGKTALAAFMTAQYIKINKDEGVAFFSVEMSKHQIFERIMSQYTHTPINVVRADPLKYTDDLEQLSNCNLHIYDNDRTVEAIRLRLMGLKSMGKLPRLVFVDFIQNIQGIGKEYEVVTNTTLQLQSMAGELGITIIALSQVSNEGVKSRSEVIPYKGSGAIAASADFGMVLLRNKEAEAKEKLLMADLVAVVPKNRHGKAGKVVFFLDTANGLIKYSHDSQKSFK